MIRPINVMPTPVVLASLIALNMLTFCLFGIDKWKAKHAKWRIPEATLLLLAVIGGSIGAWCGMKAFRHKTKHKKFKYGVPMIIVVQVGVLVVVLSHF